MPEQKTKRARPLVQCLLSMLLLFLGSCCLGLLSLFFSAGDHGLHLFTWYLTQPMVLVLNLLPFVLLTLLLCVPTFAETPVAIPVQPEKACVWMVITGRPSTSRQMMYTSTKLPPPY